MAKNFVQHGDVIDITLAATVASGDLFRVGSRLGVVLEDGDSGDVVPVQISGAFRAPKTAANTIAVGDMLNFDSSAGELTTGAAGAAGDLTDAAMAIEAAAGGETDVVALLGNFGSPT